jgi:hypothetical protein
LHNFNCFSLFLLFYRKSNSSSNTNDKNNNDNNNSDKNGKTDGKRPFRQMATDHKTMAAFKRSQRRR